MDSITQATLGAALSVAVLRKRMGWGRAALLGAVAGTIPDLDVLIPQPGAIAMYSQHRGFSHSLVFAPLATPVLAWLTARLRWFKVEFKDIRLHLALYLALATHPLLDALTIYGTQLFWPLPVEPVGVGSVFIIDPIYTVPLLLGLLLAIRWPRFNTVGLALSTLWLLLLFGAQQMVLNEARRDLPAGTPLIAQPTAFNPLRWRVLAMFEDHYRTGYVTWLPAKPLAWQSHPRSLHLASPLHGTPGLAQLQWFTRGFYAADMQGDQLILKDLRMGTPPDDLAFRFAVATMAPDGTVTPRPEAAITRLPRPPHL